MIYVYGMEPLSSNFENEQFSLTLMPIIKNILIVIADELWEEDAGAGGGRWSREWWRDQRAQAQVSFIVVMVMVMVMENCCFQAIVQVKIEKIWTKGDSEEQKHCGDSQVES